MIPDAHFQNSSMSFVSCRTDLLSPHGTATIITPGRPPSEYILKQIRHIQVALHEVIDTTGSTLSKFRNDDPALDQASSYPLCNAHNQFSTFATSSGTSLPDHATAKITEDAARTPTIWCYPRPQSLTVVPLSSPLIQTSYPSPCSGCTQTPPFVPPSSNT